MTKSARPEARRLDRTAWIPRWRVRTRTSLLSSGCFPRRVLAAYGGVARMRPNGSRSKRSKRDPIFRVPAIHAKIARFFIDKLSRQRHASGWERVTVRGDRIVVERIRGGVRTQREFN